MVTIKALLESLTLQEVGANRFRASNVDMAKQVVFGGQLLGQAVVAAMRGHEGKAVKTIHMVFARAASPEVPVEIVVDPVHAGRSFASSSVSIGQGDRLCARSVVLLSADEADLIRHADAAPDVVTGPEQSVPMRAGSGDWEVRVAGAVDVGDPDCVGPAALDVWTRFAGAPADPVVDQALLAFVTDGFLIGTAMLPHPGVGQAQAHVSLATGVISHTLTFHEPCRARDWTLLANRSPYAGRGRSYGRADVFQDGALVASYVQDAMIRPMQT